MSENRKWDWLDWVLFSFCPSVALAAIVWRNRSTEAGNAVAIIAALTVFGCIAIKAMFANKRRHQDMMERLGSFEGRNLESRISEATDASLTVQHETIMNRIGTCGASSLSQQHDILRCDIRGVRDEVAESKNRLDNRLADLRQIMVAIEAAQQHSPPDLLLALTQKYAELSTQCTALTAQYNELSAQYTALKAENAELKAELRVAKTQNRPRERGR